MSKKMLIDAAHPEEVRVALLNQGKVEDFDFESEARKPLRGNIYLARVTRVEPSLQAAFVDYGGNRHGFLAFSEIHPDYYQVPVSDRKALQDAEAAVAELAAKLELVQRGDEHDDEDDRHDDDASDTVGNDEDDHQSEAVELADTSEDQPVGEDGNDEDLRSRDGDSSQADAEEEEEEEIKTKTKTRRGLFGRRRLFPSLVSKRSKSKNSGSDSAASDDDVVEALSDNASDNHVSSIAANTASEDDDIVENDEASEEVDERRSERAALIEQYKDAKRNRSALLRNYKIQEVIKRRQILLIQVVREERGNKGAALTTYMSLAGRYCVLMPNTARGGGISRKIPSQSDRKRLRRCVDSLDLPQGMGLIIRTAGAKRTKAEIKRDYDYLIRLWENIRTLTLKSIAPCLIYEEASLIKRAIRDMYDKDISSVIVEGETGYREAKDFMKMLMPSHAKAVQPYKEAAPIFLRYNVENQLDAMYQPTARLKSGGYLVIHQTEALVAIDVNSGRATRERNIEQTALRTNIEAAVEGARQFRLRDLAGLIVIDFIDMEEPKNNRKVEKALKDALKTDRARIQVGRISSFGLLEMSRQRRRSGIVDGTTHSCPTCTGAGVVRSNETAALRILRAIEGEAVSGKVGVIVAQMSLEVSQFILNKHRDWLQRIESDNGVVIEITADNSKFGDAFELTKSGTPKERKAVVTPISVTSMDVPEDDVVSDDEQQSTDSDEKREDGKPRRRRRRRGRKSSQDSDESIETAESATNADEEKDDAKAESADGEESSEEPKRKRRRRGRRGGRRNKRADANANDENTPANDGADAASQSNDAPSQSDGSGKTETTTDEPVADSTPTTVERKETPGASNGQQDAAPVEQDTIKIEEPAPIATEVVKDEPPTPPKPARKGWWQTPTS